MDGTCCRQCAVLPQLVDIGTATAHGGCGRTVHSHHRHGLRLPADGRTVDEPSAEAQPDGGRVQHGKRKFHAGDKAAGERLFREPAHTLLLPQAVEQGLDQRGQSLPCLHRAGHAGQRQVVCRGEQFHQAADREGVFDVCVRLQVCVTSKSC